MLLKFGQKLDFLADSFDLKSNQFVYKGPNYNIRKIRKGITYYE